MNKIEQMAYHEMEWWKAHHRKDSEKLIREIAELYVLLFGVSYKEAKRIVKPRVEAGMLHDKAEFFEDTGDQKGANTYWIRTKIKLQNHFELLEEKRKK